MIARTLRAQWCRNAASPTRPCREWTSGIYSDTFFSLFYPWHRM